MNSPLHSPAPGRLLLLLLLCLLLSPWARAQQEPAMVHYWQLETQFNPAAAGRSPQLDIAAAYQMHASGFDDAGGTMVATASTALQLGRTRHGLGVVFQNDEIGLFSHKRFTLQYAYHLRLLGGTLSLGAEADMLSEDVDGSKADLADGNDPAFPNSQLSGSRFDAAAGLYYARGPLSIGLSALHLTAPTIKMGETNELNVKRAYFFTAAYNIQTRNPLFLIAPSALLRYDGSELRADITARLVLQRERKRLFIGANYAPQHSVALLLGGTFKGIDLCYSYEANTEGMGLEAGQHELSLAYRLDLSLGKRGRNLHRSVRYL